MSNDKEITQKAEGKFIAQADRGGVAIVNVTSSDSLSEIDKRHRNDMLRKVENRVEQKLQASLYRDRAINIQLDFCHDLVDYTDEAEQNIISDISQAFDATEGRLLIVGEPGAGKTILLYTLGKMLIKRASQEDLNAIPVILNLSSWSPSYVNFKEWVIEELFNKYDVSGNLAKKWIDSNTIAFLLDGFDEVSNDTRIDCIAAINDFRSNYHAQMVVCSREQEYVSLGTHLMLQGAVIALSLTDEQIYNQLTFEELRGLREVVKVDRVLHELAHTPLFIDIMSRSYGSLQSGDILDKFSSQTFLDNDNIIEIYKWQVFSDYIDRMFHHYASKHDISNRSKRKSTKTSEYNFDMEEAQLLHYLSCLAESMLVHGQTTFLLSNIQPTWLRTRKQMLLYGLLSFLILFALGGIVIGIPTWITTGMFRSLSGAILWGGGTVAYIIYSLITKPIKPIQKLIVSWAGVATGVRFLTNSSWFIGLAILSKSTQTTSSASAISSWGHWIGVISSYFAIWFLLAPVAFLIYRMSKRRRSLSRYIDISGDPRDVSRAFFFYTTMVRRDKNIFDEMEHSPVPRRKLRRILFLITMTIVPVLAVIDGITGIAQRSLFSTFFTLVLFAIGGSLLGGIGTALFFGLDGESIDDRDETNQAITRSMYIAIIGGLLSGIGCIILIAHIYARFPETVGNFLAFVLIIPLMFIYTRFLKLGGAAFVQHYVVRLILSWKGYAPFDYLAFLNSATRLFFLQQIGGGYEFIHRDFMEHFVLMVDTGEHTEEVDSINVVSS